MVYSFLIVLAFLHKVTTDMSSSSGRPLYLVAEDDDFDIDDAYLHFMDLPTHDGSSTVIPLGDHAPTIK